MAVVKVWGRGQLTIPISLRREISLGEEAVMSIVNVGESIILTPKKLIGDVVAKKGQREMKKIGLNLENILADLEKQRKRYNKERYEG